MKTRKGSIILSSFYIKPEHIKCFTVQSYDGYIFTVSEKIFLFLMNEDLI